MRNPTFQPVKLARNHQYWTLKVLSFGGMSEDEGVIGEIGVRNAQAWLESTTYFDMPHTAYDLTTMTTLPLLGGGTKKWDLAGRFMGERKNPVFCEVKNYKYAGNQGNDYVEFLANAYSASMKERLEGVDQKRYYFWITWHPFLVSKWKDLTSEHEIKGALEAHPSRLGGHAYDEDFGRELSERVWLVVLSRPLEQVMLTVDELHQIRALLKRDRQ